MQWMKRPPANCWRPRTGKDLAEAGFSSEEIEELTAAGII